jgi:integrase
MASIFQNSETKKWEFVFGYNEKGKRKQVRRRGFRTKKEANEKLIELQKEVQDDEYVDVNYITLGNYMMQWLETERIMECDETTFYNNKLYLKNNIIPRIGDIKLQKLNPMICQEFVHDMHTHGYARNTIDRVCTLIKQSLDRAVIYKYIKENHMRKVKLPKKEKKEMNIWTLEQVNHFLQSTFGNRFYCVYAIALMTGMRQGEILGLRWKDIDFEKKVITVCQTLTHYGKSIKSGTKTNAGQRRISIPYQLVEVLKKQRIDYVANKFRLGTDFVDLDIVIYNLKNGKTVFPSNLTKVYLKDVKDSGLPHIAFHSMRHTHATMLIEKNINVKIISERLGHSKVAITLDTYSHVLPSMQEEVANQLNKMISL